METESKLNITLPENWDPAKPLEIIHTTREEIPHLRRNNHKIIGVLASIVAWVAARTFKPSPAENKEIVVYSINPDKPFIKFYSDPTDPLGPEYEVSTELKLNPDLQAFGINSDRKFNRKELKNLVRRYAHLFPTTEECRDLMQKLDNFQAKFTTLVEKADDRAGNTKDLVQQAIEFTRGELPKVFNLLAPIYSNTTAVPLVLDIEVDKQGNEAVFSFYCLEYEKVRVDQAAALILNQVNEVKDKFVCIEQP